MVYGAAFWASKDDEAISKLGYDDSKGLTAEVRERMFKGIQEKEKERIGFTTVAIPAAAISAKMLRAHPYSLNKMSWACCVSMVERILAEGVNVTMVYVDTVGDPQIYESWLKRQFKGQVDFTVRKKADGEVALGTSPPASPEPYRCLDVVRGRRGGVRPFVNQTPLAYGRPGL